MNEWLRGLPKAELHLHIEGSLEPQQMFELAARNNIKLPYSSVEEAQQAYQFDDLQSFLDLYHQGMSVLQTQDDFYDLAYAYFQQLHLDGGVHADISFDPQGHLHRGVQINVPFEGLLSAMADAEEDFGITSSLIMSFWRDASADEALEIFELATPWHQYLSAVGLDNAEAGNPPSKFRPVFERAQSIGLERTAHAGEEGPAGYIKQAMYYLNVGRVDHGVRCLEDPDLVAELRDLDMPITVCPLSNVSLQVVKDIQDHPVKKMVEAGLNVNINSDDPAYFGGSMLKNYIACADAFGWSKDLFRKLAANSLRNAYLPEALRNEWVAQIENYAD